MLVLQHFENSAEKACEKCVDFQLNWLPVRGLREELRNEAEADEPPEGKAHVREAVYLWVEIDFYDFDDFGWVGLTMVKLINRSWTVREHAFQQTLVNGVELN